jgi:phosphatidylserine/phosphatidylglycerophosphate/cardiolipin synthase-like enzyme
MRSIFIGLLLAISCNCFANRIEVCFVPGEYCENKIVKEIDKAKKQVLVQAYSFTDYDIANALINAKHRNVDVEIVIDKSQIHNELLQELERAKIIIHVDYKPRIAHNKIMIIDKDTIITGSYNFTKAAQKYNAENLLIIEDKNLARKYINNWQLRNLQSINLSNYLKIKAKNEIRCCRKKNN